MTLRLHLGVVDVPYSEPTPRPRRASRGKPARPRKVASGTQTTGDVATWLENRYQVMAIFAYLHEKEIKAAIEEGLVGELENRLMDAPPNRDAFGAATSQIETVFRDFLDNDEIAKLGMVPGVPTAAALRGVNHRMMHPYARRAARPSFLDTGLYSASFRAWIER